MAILVLVASVDCYFRCMSEECYSQHGAGQRYQVVWPCIDTYQTSELTPQALRLTNPSSQLRPPQSLHVNHDLGDTYDTDFISVATPAH